MRKFYKYILKYHAKKIFVVGKFAIQKFVDSGFNGNRLVNLPIFIKLTKLDKSKLTYIRQKYSVRDDDILLVSGSRLIKSKGFDDLINAVSILESQLLQKIKLLAVFEGFYSRQNFSRQEFKHGAAA